MLAVSLAAGFVYALWLGCPQAGVFEWTILSILAAVAASSVLASSRGMPRLRIANTVALFVLMLASVGLLAWRGTELLAFDPWPDARYKLFYGALLVATIAGLVGRVFPARWLAMALAVAGIASSGLNLAPVIASPSAFAWMLAVGIIGSALVLINLHGAAMRDVFGAHKHTLWTRTDKLMRAMRWMLLTHMAAIPMLLVYAWTQPLVPQTKASAVVLALVLGVSALATLARKVVGAVALAAGGIALLVHSAVTLRLAFGVGGHVFESALYYAVFWIPAGCCALVTGLLLIRPVARLLRAG
jgi:hypothetical protein